MRTFATHLADPMLPGDRPITTAAAAEALEFLLAHGDPETWLDNPQNADMLMQYVCARYEKGEIEGARKTLLHHIPLTGVYQIEAILHTPQEGDL